jgi:hypothetical protein
MIALQASKPCAARQRGENTLPALMLNPPFKTMNRMARLRALINRSPGCAVPPATVWRQHKEKPHSTPWARATAHCATAATILITAAITPA